MQKTTTFSGASSDRPSVFHQIIESITQIFTPVIGLISAAGVLKGALALLTALKLLSSESETCLVLSAMADSAFYFLPVLLGASAARRFGGSPYICAAIAGVLLHPAITEAFAAGPSLHFFGFPFKSVSYASGVLPIIAAAALLGWLEKKLNRLLPEVLRGIFTPLLCLVIVSAVTLGVFGPAGAIVGDLLAGGYGWIYEASPILAGLLLGASIQVMVIFGISWAFVLIAMTNIEVLGCDTILAIIAPAVFAQVGVGLAVMLKSRDPAFKAICASATLSALFGITEPMLFAVDIPYQKPLLAVCLGGGLGGALVGFSGAQALSFALPSLASLPVFIGPGFGLLMAANVTGFLVGFLTTMVMPLPLNPLTPAEA